MKKTIACLLACAALGLAMPQDSQALTEAQHKQYLKASEGYRAADAKLTSVWRQLKGKLSAAEFAALLKDQRQWIASRREIEAKALIAQSIPEIDAYTAAITSRVNELSERLGAKPASKAGEKPAPAAPASKPKPVLTITKPTPAESAAPAKAAEPAAKSEKSTTPAKETKPTEPASKSVKPATEPAGNAAKSGDKPARIEIGLPYLDEEKPAARQEAKQPAKTPQAQGNAAPHYKRAFGTPEHPLAKGNNPACSGLQIVSSRYYGNGVAVPFVEMILRNDKIGNVKAVRVNGYEIRKAQKNHLEKPKWFLHYNTVVLEVFAHTEISEIGVEYADGSVCTIDKRSGNKDFTNPYIF